MHVVDQRLHSIALNSVSALEASPTLLRGHRLFLVVTSPSAHHRSGWVVTKSIATRPPMLRPTTAARSMPCRSSSSSTSSAY